MGGRCVLAFSGARPALRRRPGSRAGAPETRRRVGRGRTQSEQLAGPAVRPQLVSPGYSPSPDSPPRPSPGRCTRQPGSGRGTGELLARGPGPVRLALWSGRSAARAAGPVCRHPPAACPRSPTLRPGPAGHAGSGGGAGAGRRGPGSGRGPGGRRRHRLPGGSTEVITGERVSAAEGGFNPTFQRHVAAYRLCAPLLPEGLVLDLGCGTGHSYRELAPRVSVGVDVEPSVLEAQQRETRVADMRRLPFPDHHFASVLSVQSLEHVPDPE